MRSHSQVSVGHESGGMLFSPVLWVYPWVWMYWVLIPSIEWYFVTAPPPAVHSGTCSPPPATRCVVKLLSFHQPGTWKRCLSICFSLGIKLNIFSYVLICTFCGRSVHIFPIFLKGFDIFSSVYFTWNSSRTSPQSFSIAHFSVMWFSWPFRRNRGSHQLFNSSEHSWYYLWGVF